MLIVAKHDFSYHLFDFLTEFGHLLGRCRSGLSGMFRIRYRFTIPSDAVQDVKLQPGDASHSLIRFLDEHFMKEVIDSAYLNKEMLANRFTSLGPANEFLQIVG